MSAGTVIRGTALSLLRAGVQVEGAGLKPSSATRQLRDMRHGEQLVGLSRLEAKALLQAAQKVPEAERSGQLLRAIAVLEIASEVE